MKYKLIVFGFLLMSLIVIIGVFCSSFFKPLMIKDLNKLQKANVDFKSFDVSFIKDFPNVSIKLSHVIVTRPENFLDTLATVHSIELMLPFSSIWDNHKRATLIELNHPIFWFDSTKNWKIFNQNQTNLHFIDDKTRLHWNYPSFLSTCNKKTTYFYPQKSLFFINTEEKQIKKCCVRKEKNRDKTIQISWIFSKKNGQLLMNDSANELETSGIKRIEFYE
jgi:hypothetical protein